MVESGSTSTVDDPKSSARPTQRRGAGSGALAAALAGLLSWLIAPGLRLFSVPVSWWRIRDDAVITLSHAQNLVSFGSIGVAPGDRVEGFSSPLQFLLATIFFAVTHLSYSWFLDLQVLSCFALSGALAALTLRAAALKLGADPRRAGWWGAGVSAAMAAAIASSWTTTGWLASGMESPLATTLGIAIAWMCARGIRTCRDAALVGTSLTLFGLVRIEFPLLVLPLAAAIAILIWLEAPADSRRKLLTIAASTPFVSWGLIHGARWVYFGQPLPNTAAVQNKAVGPSQLLMLFGLLCVYAMGAGILLRAGTSRGGVAARAWLAASTAGLLVLVTYAVLHRRLLLAGDDNEVAFKLLLGATFVALAWVQYLVRRASPDGWLPDLVLAGLAYVPLSQFLVMGPARMESVRVLSLIIPFLLLWLGTGLVRLFALRDAPPLAVPARIAGGFVVGCTLVAVVVAGLADRARDLPWIISPLDQLVLQASDAFGGENLSPGVLPIVANPDLGKVSFPKRAMIVDLGWLGDPLLTRVSSDRPDLEARYLDSVAKPDVVEAHELWSCRYEGWLTSPAFLAQYRLTQPTWATSVPPTGARCPLEGRIAIWERSGDGEATTEWALARGIAGSSDPAALVRQATTECTSRTGGAFRCEAVRRAITRNTASLRARGLWEQTVAACSDSPSYPMDKHLLLREPGWASAAFREFVTLADLG